MRSGVLPGGACSRFGGKKLLPGGGSGGILFSCSVISPDPGQSRSASRGAGEQHGDELVSTAVIRVVGRMQS